MSEPKVANNSKKANFIERIHPPHGTKRNAAFENGEEFLEKYNSIVKEKLTKPIDLKKVYYEQLENMS